MGTGQLSPLSLRVRPQPVVGTFGDTLPVQRRFCVGAFCTARKPRVIGERARSHEFQPCCGLLPRAATIPPSLRARTIARRTTDTLPCPAAGA